MLAGASAVQVGTASFADPGAAARVADEVVDWVAEHGPAHGVTCVSDLTGAAHR